jgi:hypothetical protein
MTTNQQLRQLLIDNKLTHAQAAKTLGNSIRTVDNWLSSKESTNYRKMPAAMLELLKLKLRR